MKNYFLLCLLLICACSQKPEEVLCTTEFKQIYVEVYNLNGQLVELDDYQLINIKTNENLTDEIGSLIELPNPGRYLIADDATDLKGETLELLFLGVLNNEIVVREIYLIGRDICHVQLISGEEQIIISN